MIGPDSNLINRIELLTQYFTGTFTLSCKVNASAKYSDGIMVDIVVNSNKNQRASCPYYASKFKDNKELLKHIDRIHQVQDCSKATPANG
jgi:hypothetical protein